MSERLFGRRQMIQNFHDYGIIKRQGPNYPDGFKLKSGKVSDIYVNVRDLIRFPSLFAFTVLLLTELVSNNYERTGGNPCILGIPTMGAVLAPVIAYKKSMKLAVIRQNKRDHGIGKNVEGDLTNDIILIDDVITSGKSITEVIENYIEPVFGKDYNLNVFVIADRRENQDNNFKVESLMTLDEIRTFTPRISKPDSFYKLPDGRKSHYSSTIKK
jgi:orotate phosphoribosyltransferase